jgi:hypothetical protein
MRQTPWRAILAVAILSLSSCTTTASGPWSVWAHRDPETLAEWTQFYPLAMQAIDRCDPCRAPGCGDDQANCSQREASWRGRIRRVFLATHPDLDRDTRQYVAEGSIEPVLDAATLTDLVKERKHEVAQQEIRRQQASRAEAEDARKAEVASRRREEQTREELAARGAYVVSTAATIGCEDPITLQTVLEYGRVGDSDRLAEMVLDFGAPCQLLPSGKIVMPSVQRSEYWEVQLAVGDFPFPVRLWVLARDLKKMK